MADTYFFDTSRLLSWDIIKERIEDMQRTLSREELAANPPTLAVVVSCGSYNPITTAHVQMFDSAKSFLDGKPFVPEEAAGEAKAKGLATPPKTTVAVGGYISPVNDRYGKADLAPFSSRREACELTFKNSNWITVEAWEGTRPEYQRTFTVLMYIREKVREHYYNTAPTEADARMAASLDLYFLCGGDLFETFYRSGVWELDLLERLFTEFKLLVVSRAGSRDPLDTIAAHTEPLTHPSTPDTRLDLHLYRDRVLVICIPPNEISSTQVRALLRKEGGTVEGLISDETAAFLKDKRVY